MLQSNRPPCYKLSGLIAELFFFEASLRRPSRMSSREICRTARRRSQLPGVGKRASHRSTITRALSHPRTSQWQKRRAYLLRANKRITQQQQQQHGRYGHPNKGDGSSSRRRRHRSCRPYQGKSTSLLSIQSLEICMFPTVSSTCPSPHLRLPSHCTHLHGSALRRRRSSAFVSGLLCALYGGKSRAGSPGQLRGIAGVAMSPERRQRRHDGTLECCCGGYYHSSRARTIYRICSRSADAGTQHRTNSRWRVGSICGVALHLLVPTRACRSCECTNGSLLSGNLSQSRR